MITTNSSGQPLSEEFISALTADDRQYRGKLLINGVELDGDIKAFSVTKGSCGSSEGFSVGDVVGSTLTAGIMSLSTPVKGETIEARVGVLTDAENETYEYVTLGYFKVSEAPQTKYLTSITAYGKTITHTGASFTPPATPSLANIAGSITAAIYFIYGDTVTIAFDTGIDTSEVITAPLDGLTLYQALQVLASACGGFAVDTADGNIAVHRFSDTPTVAKDTEIMLELPVMEEEDFAITGVTCIVNEESEAEVNQPIAGTAVGYSLKNVNAQSTVRTGTQKTITAETGVEIYGSGTYSFSYIEDGERITDTDEFEVAFTAGTAGNEVIAEIESLDDNAVFDVKIVYTGAAAYVQLDITKVTTATYGTVTMQDFYITDSTIPAVEYTSGEPVNLIFQNSYMTESLFDDMGLIGYTYRPATMELTYGDPRLEGNDVVSVTVDQDQFIVPCHMVTHTFTGGFHTDIQAVKATAEENSDGAVAPITGALDMLTANMISAKASAQAAQQSAETAQQSATSAVANAQTAATAADNAQASAAIANTAAQEAKADAATANGAAKSALTGLSQVEDVVNVVTWIAEHGAYAKTSDQSIIDGKVYYTITATAVASPTVDEIGTYYELNAGAYSKTTDTTIVSGKTYYTVQGAPVAEPTAAQLGTYYELTVSAAVSNYIQSHLALTNAGLYVLTDANGWKVLISTGAEADFPNAGVYVLNPSNSVAAFFGEDGLEVLHGSTTIAHLGYGLGNAPSGTAQAPYYTLGTRASGSAIGNYSNAEGLNTTASGYCSHSEGYNTIARSGYCTHAEGYSTISSGYFSHAEGDDTEASGYASHSQNKGTIAGYDYQTAIGKYNDNKSNNAFEIGWGTSSTPKNILEVDTDGNLECANVGAPTAVSDFTVSKTSGKASCAVEAVRKSGNMMMLALSFTCDSAYNSTDVTNHNNLFVGTIPSKYKPAIPTSGVGYIQSQAVVADLGASSGKITVRPTATLAQGAKTWIYFTYFI